MEKSNKLTEVKSRSEKRHEQFLNRVIVVAAIMVLAGAFLTALI
ncbi:hypothetical protein [Alkalicoccobacillus gibsonii]|nr:hypothetical protein [Alkalicoccobacillus gibsonii]